MTIDYIETLAKAIHANYVKEQTAAGSANLPNVVPWDELPEEFKESNRNAARSFEEKLRSIDCEIAPADTSRPAVEFFDDETILKLARVEHDRWMQEKLANGWTYAPVRDNAKKHHHMLIPYEKLPSEEQQKDINVVNNIIPLLRSVGLRVCRKEHT